MLKSYIRTYMRQHYETMLRGDPHNQLSKKEWRMQFLEQAAAFSKNRITTESCVRLCNHVSRLYCKVLKYQDI